MSKVVLSVPFTNEQTGLRAAAQALGEIPSKSQAANNENEDNTVNKNNGLINTIVNHNEKLKMVENKINYIVNNFANSSHIKEIVEKTKEIENHVFGAPRPHAAWREFVLVFVCVVAVLYVMHKAGTKLVLPYVWKLLSEKTKEHGLQINTISGQVENKSGMGQKSLDEDKWMELNLKVEQLARKIHAREPTTDG